ncbi:hypothetical protein HG535_0G03640 [Zygotorulaspora mrakii]|uniref:4a-hydroxytetrahydrobiopterin dehydratase n=1 Tax=Zygotorulaspora mrakii TaxID=42260 RepID=A0A7H9B707_ZYGMR|nr:uncharacterized protein HG535_0G03640 [Zygotorulaspora mrakii]QLG74481.1 hypothetical protein HG535_0G03640 [Zygotorulaspora mrakii]
MYNKLTKVAPIALSAAEINKKLAEIPSWLVVNNVLTRDIRFKDYETTWAFLNQVAMRSHLWGHHPTITTTYSQVKLELTTHSLENKVSDIDLKLAKRYERYVNLYEKN